MLDRFQGWLTKRIEAMEGPVIVFETPWVNGRTHQKTARLLLGMAAVTELTAHQLECRCMEATTTVVFQHFTGIANAKRREKKKLTIAACEARGFRPMDDNEADAIALLDYAAHCLGIKTDIPDGPLFTGKEPACAPAKAAEGRAA
jgi:hypothetical protein